MERTRSIRLFSVGISYLDGEESRGSSDELGEEGSDRLGGVELLSSPNNALLALGVPFLTNLSMPSRLSFADAGEG